MEKKVPWIVRLFDPRMWLYDFVKWTGALIVSIDLRVKRIFAAGRKKTSLRGRYIVSSNHMSYIDPIILSAAFWNRRLGFIATNELFKTKIWNAFFRGVGCIPIDKRNPSLSTFKAVKERLRRGHLVCVFPEGEVTRTEDMGEFKSGVVMMAMVAQADILPVYLVKREKRWKRQIAVIGEKIEYNKCFQSPVPSLDEIRAVKELLVQKEHELEEFYKNTVKEGKR